jgi:dTDP-4-dehydrorhamnose 3,5-epimerase
LRFARTEIGGVYLVDLDPHADERGFFARVFCRREFEARGLAGRFDQASLSFNATKGTLRGIHYQAPPCEEAKLVRCTRGALFDVAVDLRPGSPTRGRHVSAVLSARNRRAIYVPEGVAHGFQTLEDETEVLYHMSRPHAPTHARGVRWDDPAFGIAWPPAERTICARDRSYPDFAA